MGSRIRVTYATLSADNEDLHTAYEEGLQVARSWLGTTIPARCRDGRADHRSHLRRDQPGRPLGPAVHRPRGHRRGHRRRRRRAPRRRAGRHTPWRERVAILRRAADLISERSAELAALMSMEVGKNRLEALGDVEESADFIRYYCPRSRTTTASTKPMGRLSDAEVTSGVMRPYGVWAVIVPFNFPMALAAGPTGGRAGGRQHRA